MNAEKQILSFQSQVLEDSRPIVSYGIESASVISLIKFNSFRGKTLESGTLRNLDFAVSQIKESSKSISELMKKSDSILSLLQELHTVPSNMDSKNIMEYQLHSCLTETSEISDVLMQLIQKYVLVQSQCNRLQKRLQMKSNEEESSNPVPQMSPTSEPKDVTSVKPNETPASTVNVTPDLQNLPGVDALQDYLIVLNRRHQRASLPQLGVMKPSESPTNPVNASVANGESIPAECDSEVVVISETGASKEDNHQDPIRSVSTINREVEELIEMNDGDLAIDAMDEEDEYVQEAEECAWNEEEDEAGVQAEIKELANPPRIYHISDSEVDDLSKRADYECICVYVENE